MKIVCIMPCRNSDWVLGLSARAVLMWANELIVLDHASTDETARIANGVKTGFVSVVHCDEGRWAEMAHRQALLECAREAGATHIALIDDDEVLTGDSLPCIRDYFERLPAGQILTLPWLAMRGSHLNVEHIGMWAEQTVSAGFVDEPYWRWETQRDGYEHHHRHPMGRAYRPWRPFYTRQSGVMHLQFANERRLRAKQALYKLNERLRWPGRWSADRINQYYNLAVYGAAENIGRPHFVSPAPASWWEPYKDLMQYFKPEAEPWQESEVRRIVAENPGIAEGLDLFGVI